MLYVTYISVKKKKRKEITETLSPRLSPIHQAGIQGSHPCYPNLDTLTICVFLSTLLYVGNLSFSSSDFHSFNNCCHLQNKAQPCSTRTLLSTEQSASLRNPFTTSLLHLILASGPWTTCISLWTPRPFLNCLFTWASQPGGPIPLTMEVPSVFYVLVKYI